METRKILAILVLAMAMVVWPMEVSEAGPMGTAFTYQGRLSDEGSPAEGKYDFQFKLYDADSDGNGPQPTLDGPNPHNQATLVVTIDFGDSDRAILPAEIGAAGKVEITGGTITDKVSQNTPTDTVWLVTIVRDSGDSNVSVTVHSAWYQDAAGNDNSSASEAFEYIELGPEVWVDDDYTEGGYNDGHVWGYDAFATIQEGIDAGTIPTVVHVAAGTYYENITMFSGVHVIGAGPGISIIDGNSSGSVVTAIDVNSTAELAGFTITNGSATYGGGLYDYNSGMLVSNCLFTGNSADYGGGMYNEYECSPLISNCTFAGNTAVDGNAIACDSPGQSNPSILQIRDSIIWDGINGIWNNDGSTITINYSDVQGGWVGVGNLDSDPNFGDPCNGDYHLMSQAGRWYSQTQYLVHDDVTSPCIDAGDPNSSIGWEPFPNGGRINMGAYGGTEEASKSYFGTPVCTKPIAGDINGDCKVDWFDFAIMAFHWLEDNNP
ncbi:MAG: hypothetical protein ACYTBZ_28885 [Planctomycetota bacterium]|jgi:hypothetical protein